MNRTEYPPGYGLFKSLRYHAIIARKLREKPDAVLLPAMNAMERWGWLDPGHEAYHAAYARQWRQAVDQGPEHVAELIERPLGDEQADWMRSCTPLIGILDRRMIRNLQHQWRREYQALVRKKLIHDEVLKARILSTSLPLDRKTLFWERAAAFFETEGV